MKISQLVEKLKVQRHSHHHEHISIFLKGEKIKMVIEKKFSATVEVENTLVVFHPKQNK
jgi:hypothetical protein